MPVTELRQGMDFREKRYRREVFLRFYEFHLRYKSHPGGVYYVLPALAKAHEWDPEQRAWAAFLNGNTQNPVTTLFLMQAGDRPEKADRVIGAWRNNYDRLGWDTDRRYHKASLNKSIEGYLHVTGGDQVGYWNQAAARGWDGMWKAANIIPTMGRLSAWSFIEYVRIMGVTPGIPDATSLLLADRAGSRSHRNGLALVLGRDDLMWWDNNPSFDGRYTHEDLQELVEGGAELLAEARQRHEKAHYARDVGYLTLESALCTYKSWHRPNRRYAGVYNDLLWERIHEAERHHGCRFDPIWDARREALPDALRLECNDNDPGAVPSKQNWYLETGEVIVMDHDWDCFANGFTAAVAEGRFGQR